MLPIQLLVQNLLYDISQVSIPWDDVDRDYLRQPRKWDAAGIARFMVFIGPINSIFDIVTYLVMWNVFLANSVERQSLFQSGWFIEGLLTQTLIVHMIRTQHVPFIESRAATPVILLTASIMAFGIYLPFSPMGAHLGMVPLPLAYFGWLTAILLSSADAIGESRVPASLRPMVVGQIDVRSSALSQLSAGNYPFVVWEVGEADVPGEQ
jgi:P-type Mg2+ transporter